MQAPNGSFGFASPRSTGVSLESPSSFSSTADACCATQLLASPNTLNHAMNLLIRESILYSVSRALFVL
jgi:hypothetical protein